MKKMNFYFGLLLAMALVLGGFKGAAWALHPDDAHGAQETNDGHGVHGAHAEHEAHAHEVYEVPENEPAPSLTLNVMEDPPGWNLHLVTENFTFAPYHIGVDHIPGEGHGHLYINDKKITRILGPWHHIPELPEGNNTIRVSLSTNDHEYYSVNNQLVEDTAEISVAQAEKAKDCPCPRCPCPKCKCPGKKHNH